MDQSAYVAIEQTTFLTHFAGFRVVVNQGMKWSGFYTRY